MTQPPGDGEHVQLELGLYVLGALSPEEHLVVEDHLRGCPKCNAECADLAEVTAVLALVTRDEADHLEREFLG
jgi:anti-sigma factor RsiW